MHCAEETTFSEDDIDGSYLQYFRYSKGTIKDLRNTADAAVLLVTYHPFERCGESYLGRKYSREKCQNEEIFLTSSKMLPSLNIEKINMDS